MPKDEHFLQLFYVYLHEFLKLELFVHFLAVFLEKNSCDTTLFSLPGLPHMILSSGNVFCIQATC